MVYEIAEIHVLPGHDEAFQVAVRQAAPLFERAAGCSGMELQRIVEVTGKYHLVVRWETVEHHMVQFRGSADFQEWRRLVGGHLASPPAVEHAETVVKGR